MGIKRTWLSAEQGLRVLKSLILELETKVGYFLIAASIHTPSPLQNTVISVHWEMRPKKHWIYGSMHYMGIQGFGVLRSLQTQKLGIS